MQGAGIETQTDAENGLADSGGKTGWDELGDGDWPYPIPCVKQLVGACEESTGSSAWCCVMTWMEWDGVWGEGGPLRGWLRVYFWQVRFVVQQKYATLLKQSHSPTP